jgi:hypothetical protein
LSLESLGFLALSPHAEPISPRIPSDPLQNALKSGIFRPSPT